MKKLRVAMIAPPWLKIPPDGYGGIEEVIYSLVKGLPKEGVEVDLFSLKTSRVPVKNYHLYAKDQYEHIHKPLYESATVAIAHVMYALKAVAADGKYDLIHDHNGFIGPMAIYWANRYGGLPPALHTHHGPPFSDEKRLEIGIPDNIPMWRQFGEARGLFFAGISGSSMKGAPKELEPLILSPIYHGVELANFPYIEKKANHFVSLSRFSRDKGQHIAVQLCQELGVKLEMAGIIAGITDPKQLILELTNPLSNYRSNGDFQYYSNYIWPATVKNRNIKYVGNLKGRRKLNFFAQGKAFLFPIDWEEPFGMVVIEALACGTPVIAMRRGSLPEIIEHGVNGFLADSIDEFREYMQRVDEINPADCRRSVKENFSTSIMIKNYVNRYEEVIKLSKK